MIEYQAETKRINKILNSSRLKFFEKEISNFLNSTQRKNMIIAKNYYLGKHDILKRKRTIIEEDIEKEIPYLPNNKLVNNQYAKMVDQKNNYLLSKQITFKSENSSYLDALNKVFNMKFWRLFKNMGKDAINYGLSWVYPYISQEGIEFKRFNSYDVLPFWKDEDKTELELAIRVYAISDNNDEYGQKQFVEFYSTDKVIFYEYDKGKLKYQREESYLNLNGKSFSFGKVPLIAFKVGSDEIPLINRIKSLQDALNTVTSDFMNTMQEDARNTILVIKNYDATDVGSFRKNLIEQGVIKVKSFDGFTGGVETLKVEVSADNYELLTEMLKKAIIDNARGYDCKDDRMGNNPNRLNIQSMYSDIELDANSMELEFKYSFENLFYFINLYLENFKNIKCVDECVEVIFNKDMLVNESEIIENCVKSVGILSTETIIANHPYTNNLKDEIARINSENGGEEYDEKDGA